MTAFLALLLAVLLYGGLHSWLASHGVKRWAARRLGAPGARWYRLFFVITGGLTFLPVLALLYVLPGERVYNLAGPWRWLLLALQGGCLLGLAVAVSQTGALQFLGLDALRAPRTQMDSETLVTGGLYRHVRHPIYTFTLLMLALNPAPTSGWLGLMLGSFIYILAAIPLEERKLAAEFGQAYRDYQQRVPALLPGLRRRG